MAWSKDPLNQGKQGRPRKRQTGPGRPSKFTPEIGEIICNCIAKGVTLRVAAAYVGVADLTIQNWINAGLDNKDEELTQFAIDVEKAHAAFIINNLSTIEEVSKDKSNKNRWLSAAWALERCVPGQPYAVTNRQQVQVQDVTVRDQAITSAEERTMQSLEARVIDVEEVEEIE